MGFDGDCDAGRRQPDTGPALLILTSDTLYRMANAVPLAKTVSILLERAAMRNIAATALIAADSSHCPECIEEFSHLVSKNGLMVKQVPWCDLSRVARCEEV